MDFLARHTPLRPKDWLHDRIKGGPTDPDAYRREWEPRLAKRPTIAHPISQPCTADQIYNSTYRQWLDEMNQPYLMHRKQWEWVYIVQSLANAGHFIEDQHGLGFGVGTEPITALAASRGCKILATDSRPEDGEAGGWTETNQHADSLAALNNFGICAPDVFEKHVDFRYVDMRDVPSDLNGFDFTWSACAFEHLGNLEAGFDFVWKSLDCIRPGGLAVHTTEYNVSSNTDTVESGHTVFYRRQDLERLAKALKAKGHKIQITFGLGTTGDDRHIDKQPYTNCHLKVRENGHVITSFGIQIQKAS